MSRERIRVDEHATDDVNEVLVTFKVQGRLRNHLLRNHEALKTELAATPITIPNPEREKIPPMIDDESHPTGRGVNPEWLAIPGQIPNPARRTVEEKAFDAAEKELDDAAEKELAAAEARAKQMEAEGVTEADIAETSADPSKL